MSDSLTVPQPAQAVKSFTKDNLELAAKFDAWLAAQNYSPHTRRAYATTTGYLCEFICPRSLLELTHFDLREFLTYFYKRGLAPSSHGTARLRSQNLFRVPEPWRFGRFQHRQLNENPQRPPQIAAIPVHRRG